MKAVSIFREYVWLVSTIRRAGRITFDEIARRWAATGPGEGAALSRSTFNRHRLAVEEMFGLIIDCDRRTGCEYFISNEEELRDNSVQSWMLSTLAVSDLLAGQLAIRHRILLESVPSADEWLGTALVGIRQNLWLTMTYRRYGKEPKQYRLQPYCVKLCRKRWYLLAFIPECTDAQFRIFSFDRILDLQTTDDTFRPQTDFDAEAFFADYFGPMADPSVALEQITIRVYGNEVNYVRDLPLHHTQEEIATTADYSDIRVTLRPTSDFASAILSRGGRLQVLSPQWLADDLRARAAQMLATFTVTHNP